MGYEDDLNLYTYVRNDPINGVDPTGRSGCADMAAQALSGACLDASDFDAATDGAATVIGAAEIDAKAIEVAPSLETAELPELGTTINRAQDGTLSAEAPTSGEGDGSQTRLDPTAQTVAVVHSHPYAQQGFGIQPGFKRPGVGDHTAVEQGTPNYITRNGTVIVLERSGGQYRVRVVGGRLSREERRAVRDVLSVMQQDSRR